MNRATKRNKMRAAFAGVALMGTLVGAQAFAQQPPAQQGAPQQAPQGPQGPQFRGGQRPGLIAPHAPPPGFHGGLRGPGHVPGEVAHAPDDRPYPGSPGNPVLQPGEPAPHGEPGGTGHDPVGVEEINADAHGNGDVEHTESGEHGPPKPINWFDFGNKEQPPFGAMILNFVILMALYIGLGKKPIAEALKSRRSTIAKEIEEAQKMRKEAEARAEIYQEKLKHLESEVQETRAALIEAGKNERDRIVKDAEEKATRLEKDALFLVEQEVKQMRVDLTREAVEIAVAAAEELLKKRVTPVDQERLAEDYLAELTAKTKTAGSIPPSRSNPAAQAPAPQGGQS